jgi:hypothetical protein
MTMNIEVTVTVVVEGGEGWNFRVNDALRNVGHEIYMNPQYVTQKGDSNEYTFEYQVKGEA